MDISQIRLFFSLIHSAVNGTKLKARDKDLFNNELLLTMFDLAKKHDIAHLLAYALDKNSLLTQENKELGDEIIKAIYRHVQRNYSYLQMCDAFEAAEITFIPLKGSVMREYYSDPWMRTSCDIDVLVKNEDTDKAIEVLTNKCNCNFKGKSSYDISLYAPNKIHIELHYGLIKDGIVNSSSEVLSNVWNTAAHKDGYCYWYEMTDEMFYFYHIAHMAKHTEQGGCGIRPFIDLWILDNINGKNQKKRNELLKRGGLLKFAETARLLSRVWFDNAEHTEVTKQMEDYILRGGVYGTSQNAIAVQQQKKGGKFKYVFSKIVIPYDVIKYHYPILQKQRWLTPVMQVRRWFKLLFCGHTKRVASTLSYNNSISSAEAKSMQEFLKNIGL